MLVNRSYGRLDEHRIRRFVTKSPYLIPPFCKGGKEGIFPFMKGGRERGFERERGNR